MRALIPFPRALARLGTLVMLAVPLAAAGLPAAYAASGATTVTPAAVQSAVFTPMSTCLEGGHVCEQK